MDGGARVARILAARDRTMAGPAAVASGLSLMAVTFPGEDPLVRLPDLLRSSVDLNTPRATGGDA